MILEIFRTSSQSLIYDEKKTTYTLQAIKYIVTSEVLRNNLSRTVLRMDFIKDWQCGSLECHSFDYYKSRISYKTRCPVEHASDANLYTRIPSRESRKIIPIPFRSPVPWSTNIRFRTLYNCATVFCFATYENCHVQSPDAVV